MGRLIKKTDIFDCLYLFIGLPWLFFMLFTSRMYTEIKTVMLALLAIIAYSELLSNKIRFEKKDVKFVSIFILYIILSLLYGILMGYEYDFIKDFSLIQYYVITPVCILLFSTIISQNARRVEFLWSTLKYMSLVLSVLDVVRVVLWSTGMDPSFLQFIMMASDNMETKLTLRVSNEPSLMFLLPIFIYLLINPVTKIRKDRLICFTIVLFGIIYAILSGRKMLEVIIVLAVFLSLVYANCRFSLARIFNGKMITTMLLGLVALLAISVMFSRLSAIMGIDDILGLAYDTITNGLSSEADGVKSRGDNTTNLINLWLESPIWGNGLNSYAENSIASSLTKWSYEVVYVAWLAQTGIIGAYLLAFPIVYILKTLKRKAIVMKDKRFFALAVGFISFVLCGASNPVVYILWPWAVCMTFCKYNKANKVSSNIVIKIR